MSEKNKVGKPLKFKTVKILEDKIKAYFKECDAKGYTDGNGIYHPEPLTITGLALALGTTRKTLLDYENKGEYSYTVKIAKTHVENFAEKRLFGSTPTGAIFALKNYGWRDQPKEDDDGKTVVNIISADVMESKEWADTYGK